MKDDREHFRNEKLKCKYNLDSAEAEVQNARHGTPDRKNKERKRNYAKDEYIKVNFYAAFNEVITEHGKQICVLIKGHNNLLTKLYSLHRSRSKFYSPVHVTFSVKSSKKAETYAYR